MKISNPRRIKILIFIGKEKYGETNNLKRTIGEPEFKYLIKKGFIYQGKHHPEVWRITEKGWKRSRAVKSKFFRTLAKILWKLNIYRQ